MSTEEQGDLTEEVEGHRSKVVQVNEEGAQEVEGHGVTLGRDTLKNDEDDDVEAHGASKTM